jgi:NAD(P)-dependent dehydrogenase (short-subunit alcohol dehydrogenase family)
MDLKLTDKRALVSGSTKGIGLAIAMALAREGARVVINGRTEASVSAALSEILGSVPNATIEGFVGDLATPQAAELLGTKVPSVDILVNNLGIFEPKPFEQIPDDDWRRFFEVNVLSGVRLRRVYLSGMKGPRLGQDRVHQQRKRDQHSRRNDPLRHDQDSTTGGVARIGRVVRRDGGHGQRRAARTDALARGRRVRPSN